MKKQVSPDLVKTFGDLKQLNFFKNIRYSFLNF